MKVADYMTTDVVSVEIPGNRDDVLKILKRTGISGVPVLKDKKLVGIITRKDMLRKSEETQLGLLMAIEPKTISPDSTLVDAAFLMIKNNIRRLPVVEGETLIGLLSVADLVHAIAQMKISEEIKEHFTSQTFAIWEETPLPLVGRIMEISGFEAIPILDSESRLQGIISERDLIRNSSIEDIGQQRGRCAHCNLSSPPDLVETAFYSHDPCDLLGIPHTACDGHTNSIGYLIDFFRLLAGNHISHGCTFFRGQDNAAIKYQAYGCSSL